MDILSAILQCGAFIIIPLVTFGFGIWKILQVDQKYYRISVAGLIGFIACEASLIGMIIDPRSVNMSFREWILTSGIMGIITFLFVLLFLPVSLWIYRIFRK